jgi:diguanylate cyclase (GGDEF)-like protein
VLRECFRRADVIGRLGGDEFVVAAIDSAPSSRAALEQRLSEMVKQSNEKPGRAFQLSLSVGALTCDNSLGGISIEELLARADALMYQQKRDRKTRGK